MQDKVMKTNSKIQDKRAFLRELSRPIQDLVKIGAIESVNEGLKDIYAQQGHEELKTIHQWNSTGKQVKKGEKALLLWGSPKKYEVEKTESEEKDELDYYPICFVFSNLQVIDAKKGGTK